MVNDHHTHTLAKHKKNSVLLCTTTGLTKIKYTKLLHRI